MRTLIRYIIVTGALVVLAWSAFGLQVKGRTLFGHARAMLVTRPTPSNIRAQPHNRTNERRVAQLRNAARRVSTPQRADQPARRTRTDERLSPRATDAISALLDRNTR